MLHEQRIPRHASLYPRWIRFFTRTAYSPSGTSVLVNSILGADGIPIGIQSRSTSSGRENGRKRHRASAWWEGGAVKMVTVRLVVTCKTYKFSTLWVSTLLLVGAISQWVIR